MSETTIYDMTDRDLAEQLVGKSIKTIAGETIELTDGTVLEIQGTSDCCAWFQGDIEAFDFDDNVITAVEEHDAEAWYEDDEAWSLHVVSAHKLIAKVNIEGNATSGYYCHSVNLIVKAGAFSDAVNAKEPDHD